MTWIHIDFFFRNTGYYKALDNDEQFIFENLVRRIIKRTRWCVRRKFYLYEPQPNCFLALEMRSVIFIPVIMFLCYIYRNRYYFIRNMEVHTKGGKDEDDKYNGEGFLNIINAFTEWYLFDKFNSKTKLHHIIHCCMEFQAQTRYAELDYYKQMLKAYGEEDGTKGSDTKPQKPPRVPGKSTN